MKSYRVYTKPNAKSSMVVKIGFSWGAFIFGPLWFLVNKMWFNFIIVVSFIIGANVSFSRFRPQSVSEAWFVIGMSFLYFFVWFVIGRLANSLLCGELEEKGYKLRATVLAKNPDEAREVAAKPHEVLATATE